MVNFIPILGAVACLVFSVDARPKVHRTKVAILGAGGAGISAAKRFNSANMKDFIIVDAQSFVGGRVQHTGFGDYQVEIGANWIYGQGSNPIYNLATKHGLKTAPNEKDDVEFYDDDGQIKDGYGRQVYDTFAEYMVDLVNYASQRVESNQVDVSARTGLSMVRWKPDTSLKAAVEYFSVDWELAEPAELASLDYSAGTAEMIAGTYPGEDGFVVDERGFNHILKEETRLFLKPNDPRLMLNTLVTDITYGAEDVVITTADGDTIIADYCICTFSLGVLQSDSVNFVPAFPDWKREALLSFHMATYTKIFLKFDTKFWGDWQFALYAGDFSQRPGYYTVWQNLNAPGYFATDPQRKKNKSAAKDNILMVTTTFKESERIEKLDPEQVEQEIVEVLKRMFPSANITKPTEILIPRWHTNPLFRGSYSNWPLGVSTQHHDNMRAPLRGFNGSNASPPRLWFSGEAMSADFYGYLHGAWFEGRDTAGSILRCMRSKCPVYPATEIVKGCSDKSAKDTSFQAKWRKA
ncbi:amine oxidase [Phycomyces blakesleeanus]|uniref:Amine oxidase domain-containing protein n=2 Tax=Phycomyces blakesleeanus TaxID=4837 RepID=A0A162V083_PHYB8|nr:hypothetical protein PHYBLDRAFT_178985 [Phycomyces blakesleeanus NRRL 1555(-)]OAD79143.1 hypothetical protein PHYBLDRAFT_178985 [Phycomyces blakesleeanus NRRL 1555(-)]|eukprot:XP_018297183.1 hypothetical protein PHYBLDRAFT_178985 [Phycomyces blakesleeanus NRRL 1555(-)]